VTTPATPAPTMLNVLVSGASIAGPALAYWLRRYGCAVTVVERAPTLRPGGQAVDFKGQTHRQVLERMGILDQVRRAQTARTDLVVVDEHDRRLATIPGEFTGGDLEVLRGDLATLLYQRTAATCRYLFGDSITALTQTASGVEVAFQQAAPGSFDLVVGADGIHSNVRRLAFGPEERFVRFLGHYYAVVGGYGGRGAAAPSPQRGTGLLYNRPGRLAWVGGPKAPTMYVFASPQLDYDRDDLAQQKRIVAAAFAGVGWQVPGLLRALPDAPEFYLDSISKVELERYTSGRVALVGDAAYGNTLGGFGTGLALVGAYVLAGELAAAGGDHRAAFGRYDQQLHRYAKIARKGNAGRFLAPPTPARIRLRNWTFRFSLPLRLLLGVTDRYATDIDLRDYPKEVERSS
jgi:2-polyprenyl-6-methoxyphenol hydroxylase-like FAD-dependent oxidoreductase